MEKYSIEEVIGEGSFGQVLRARNTVTSRMVALKKIRRHSPLLLAHPCRKGSADRRKALLGTCCGR